MRYDSHMATKAALSEADYLRTSFPGVDQEFRDGELVERSVPDLFHSLVQLKLCVWFALRTKSHRLNPLPELRNRIAQERFVIPDVCVFWPDLPVSSIPEQKPLIVIEILSPDDRMSEVMEKLQEDEDWGVVHVWLADPRHKKLYEFGNGLREVAAFRIPEVSLDLPASEIFD
jgi:Uma2 family endonuclease